jgi:hypothetical protein
MERSRFGRLGLFKDEGHIQFPETLNMTRLHDQGEESDEYRLISVASHFGSDPRDGHYTAFSLLKSHWWRFHDTYVPSVPHVPVFDANFPVNMSEETAPLLLDERKDLGTARDKDETTSQNKFLCGDIAEDQRDDEQTDIDQLWEITVLLTVSIPDRKS